MAYSYDRKTILVKVETTEGTDAIPTGAANAIRTVDYTPSFMQSDAKIRNVDVPWFGAKPVLLSALRRGGTFGVEMAGAGASATTVPAWMILNQLAGFAAGAAGASSVVQAGAQAYKSGTNYVPFADEGSANAFIMKSIGCKASVGFSISDDEFPRFNYTLLGRPPAALAESATMPTPVYANQAPPLLASTENTTFSLDGYALALRSIELNSNPEMALRSLIGPQDYVAVRNDSWSGTINGEVPLLGNKDYFANIRPGTTMVMSIVHGTVAGNIVQIDAPAVQITGDVGLVEDGGKLHVTMPVSLIPVSGNDEITFTSK
jgi:hypothetical protein